MKPSMQTYYQEKVVPALNEELKCTNPHQVPRLEKIVVTTHWGGASDRKQAVEDAVEEIY
jgi:large subunit ribosomal protein L5